MIQLMKSAESISGTVLLPGDKSISHRYAMLAAIAEGTSIVKRFAASRDCHSTLGCLRSMGVEIEDCSRLQSGCICRIRGQKALPKHDKWLI